MIIKDNVENIRKCLCGKCSSHNKTMKERMLILFCARGKAPCEVQRHGCLCPNCQIAKENGMNGVRYCEKGAVED